MRRVVWDESFCFDSVRAVHATDLEVLLKYFYPRESKNPLRDQGQTEATAADETAVGAEGTKEKNDEDATREENRATDDKVEDDDEMRASEVDATTQDRVVIPLAALDVGEPTDDWYLVSNSDALVRLCLLLRRGEAQ